MFPWLPQPGMYPAHATGYPLTGRAKVLTQGPISTFVKTVLQKRTEHMAGCDFWGISRLVVELRSSGVLAFKKIAYR